MSLAQTLNQKKIPRDLLLETSRSIAIQIRTVCSPTQIRLFGSAAEDRFRIGSDLDLMLVFETLEELYQARKQIRGLGILHRTIPVDLLFVTIDRFERMKDLGGPCFVAYHEGISL